MSVDRNYEHISALASSHFDFNLVFTASSSKECRANVQHRNNQRFHLCILTRRSFPVGELWVTSGVCLNKALFLQVTSCPSWRTLWVLQRSLCLTWGSWATEVTGPGSCWRSWGTLGGRCPSKISGRRTNTSSSSSRRLTTKVLRLWRSYPAASSPSARWPASRRVTSSARCSRSTWWSTGRASMSSVWRPNWWRSTWRAPSTRNRPSQVSRLRLFYDCTWSRCPDLHSFRGNLFSPHIGICSKSCIMFNVFYRGLKCGVVRPLSLTHGCSGLCHSGHGVFEVGASQK